MQTTDIFYGTSGPRDARIMIVGEAWGYNEFMKKQPFQGSAGKELDRMLAEAGIARDSCFCTNVISERPLNDEMWRFFHPVKESPAQPVRGLHPHENIMAGLHTLYQQIDAVKPKVIVAAGNYALWALTNQTSYVTRKDTEGRRVPAGIMSWRGSQWYAEAAPAHLSQTRLVPIIHPSAVMRAWYNRSITVHDLRERVAGRAFEADWRPTGRTVLAPPTFEQARDCLLRWLDKVKRGEKLRLMADIETARTLMTCLGLTDSKDFALVIPFIRVMPGQTFDSYWPPEQEHILLKLIRELLSHTNCLVEGQNFLYDMQYILLYTLCEPNLDFDSMLAQHLLFPGTPKALDYLSGLYCKHHWYWKEDHKEWDMKGRLEDLLVYNAEDIMRNFEVNTVLRDLIPKMGMAGLWEERKEVSRLAFEMMRRGVKIDVSHRGKLALDLTVASMNMAQWFQKILPQTIASPDVDMTKKNARPWWQSPHQQKRFFKEDLGLKLPKDRKTEADTFGHEALQTLKDKHPEFTRIFDALEEFRSIGVFHNTFVKAALDPGERMRCMFNTSGTETFRWSSSKNAFGRGTNLQNIPAGEED